eukprot:5358197-Pleurochrysis_carterae.AAC.1
MLVRAWLIFRPSASALQASSPMPSQPACTQLKKQLFIAPTTQRMINTSAAACGRASSGTYVKDRCL